MSESRARLLDAYAAVSAAAESVYAAMKSVDRVIAEPDVDAGDTYTELSGVLVHLHKEKSKLEEKLLGQAREVKD
jgi:hypothetical protein